MTLKTPDDPQNSSFGYISPVKKAGEVITKIRIDGDQDGIWSQAEIVESLLECQLLTEPFSNRHV